MTTKFTTPSGLRIEVNEEVYVDAGQRLHDVRISLSVPGADTCEAWEPDVFWTPKEISVEARFATEVTKDPNEIPVDREETHGNLHRT